MKSHSVKLRYSTYSSGASQNTANGTMAGRVNSTGFKPPINFERVIFVRIPHSIHIV
ncbi:hypothetical protein [Paenibacillus rhizoplanae]|uniref:hypothetical protein n=1 Tax=Paenibacillus rhizoplanae TaxID=1917181 RepID=UPI0036110A9F